MTADTVLEAQGLALRARARSTGADCHRVNDWTSRMTGTTKPHIRKALMAIFRRYTECPDLSLQESVIEAGYNISIGFYGSITVKRVAQPEADGKARD